ncbi:MAG TPA: DUF1841 family protein [Acidiferrobacterales bacterium]|nr:DUF1841 family protein [Acidiferrobacterales bacterium]
MDTYDPDTAPDPKIWLELDEGERLLLVSDYHDEFDNELSDDFSRAQLHASIHVVVENQLAEAYAPAVEALARLLRDGLSRHDAVHAIGSVLAEHIWTQTQGGGSADEPAMVYEQALRALTAQSWREHYDDPD